jgi:protein-tyrosine phosphatase
MPSTNHSKLRTLFVCLGNICRSPSAEAICSKMIKERKLGEYISIDSCGTLDWHTNEAPDPRAITFGEKRSYQLKHLRGRQITQQDFYDYDDILVMDEKNLADVMAIKPADATATVAPILSYGATEETWVPDPYFGGDEGFEYVLDLLEDAISHYLETKFAD